MTESWGLGVQTLLAVMGEEAIPLVAVGGGLVVAIFAIVFGTVSSTRKAARREETRREIAAYVAEGSMTAEEGERLMKAGDSDG